MASLLKFKLLATQCGVAQSPTRSPRTSPVVHFRRRKTTLRMLLSRTTSRRTPRFSPPEPVITAPKKEKESLAQGRSLKDLFVSSPPLESGEVGDIQERAVAIPNGGGAGLPNLKDGPGSPRPGWTGFRYRSLLRRAWRPMLVTIPE